MDEQQLAKTTNDVLTAFGTIFGDLKRCFLSHDINKLKGVEETFNKAMKASLPLFDDLAQKKQRSVVDEKALALLPSLQRLGLATDDLMRAVRTTIESGVSFTDKALGEIGGVVVLVKELFRDTNDAIATRNSHFCQSAITAGESAIRKADEAMLEHQQRLITGVCSPKASFVYIDIMQSLKRVARELSSVCEKAV